MFKRLIALAVVPIVLATGALPLHACTNLIVTRGASTDGSVFSTYTCDGAFHPHLRYIAPETHEPGAMLDITHWTGEMMGQIEHVEQTYGVAYLMNEFQVAIGETTFDGRPELRNPDGVLHYWVLMRLALQRARTAREAIEVITDLVRRYGYASTGESMSITDPREAWLLEIIGPGPGGEGALWVARRVPDGYICAHSNLARIREFPLDDPENCLYAENVIDFAIEQGYWDPAAGEAFSFSAAYCPATPQKLRYTATRTWSLFRRAAPSLDLPSDFHRGVAGAEPYPLWIKPDTKISLEMVFDLMRDHYEGTDYDMTQGVDAGPFGNPNRWRPMNFAVDGVDYTWERPISTQQTGFSFVSQARSHLPDPVGGVLWYGVDDTYTTCYFPLYCGVDAVPDSFAHGNYGEFSWDSAFWVFNLVANYATTKYSYMIEDIRSVQQELESEFVLMQDAVDRTATALHGQDPALMKRYLTAYSISAGEQVTDSWRRLAERLLVKYNDGYVRNEHGRVREVGYAEDWLRTVIEVRPQQFRLPATEADSLETRLSY